MARYYLDKDGLSKVASKINNKLDITGGTMSGNLKVGSSSIGTNGHIEGTWLKTSAATDAEGNFATINNEGWIYYRTPSEVLSDIGGVTSTDEIDTTENPDTVYATKGEVSVKANSSDLAVVATSGKYSDLSGKPTIPTSTSQLTNNSGYISEETDPTVPAWAKEPNKPTYTASEVGALPSTTSTETWTFTLTSGSTVTKTVYVK